MKRITWWPQAWLGLTFNWGALLGWAVVQGSLEPAAFVLYAGGFFWTLGYDTIYAHQDKEDDALGRHQVDRAGCSGNSRALDRGLLHCLSGAADAVGMDGRVWLALLDRPGDRRAHLIWQTATIDFDDPKDCLKKFRANRDFGLIIFVAAIAARALV